MSYLSKFISIWNEIKKTPSFIGKKIAVDQLNDATVFPWFLNFSKNFSAYYRKCKSNSWSHLVSIHSVENSHDLLLVDLNDKREYLIKKYNERLLNYSKDKSNPWVVDDRDSTYLILNKKNYLEFDKRLIYKIDEEIAKKFSCKDLTNKEIGLEKRRLLYLVKLALLTTYKEERLEEFNSLAINCSDWQKVYEQFILLIAQKLDDASIQQKIKTQLKTNYRELGVQFLIEREFLSIYIVGSIWEKINKFVIKNKGMQFFYLLWSGLTSHANILNWISFLLLFFSLSLYSYPLIFIILGISLISYLTIQFFFWLKMIQWCYQKLLRIKQSKF